MLLELVWVVVVVVIGIVLLVVGIGIVADVAIGLAIAKWFESRATRFLLVPPRLERLAFVVESRIRPSCWCGGTPFHWYNDSWRVVRCR